MATALRFRLARAVTATPPPPVALAKAWGLAYAATPARPLLDLSQGAPGAPPPPALLQALGAAARDPAACGYGAMDGERAMRQALVGEMRAVYGAAADVRAEDVALTAGCNMAFMAVAMALAEPGDEVILPMPWYFNHQMSLQMLGIQAVPLPCDAAHGFVPTVSDCARVITPRTRAIVLVTPNNPTGAIFSPALLASFAALAQTHNLALVVDETYRDLLPADAGAPHALFASTDSAWAWRSTFVHLFSFSKSYCVPGHRLGAIVASPALLTQVNTVLDCMQICPPRAIQHALAPLLPRLRPFLRASAETLVERHALFRAVLPRGWEVGAQGGYFAFVRHPFAGVTARTVCTRLAREGGVVALPGAFFGLDEEAGWIRFSVANVDEGALREVGARLAGCGDLFGWRA